MELKLSPAPGRSIWFPPWSALSLVLLANVFPLLTVLYLALWGSVTVPLATQGVFAGLLFIWALGLRHHEFRTLSWDLLDGLMAIFLGMMLFAYVGHGVLAQGFAYFLMLNLVAYLIGRHTPARSAAAVLAGFAILSVCVAIGSVASLPEIYRQWSITPGHLTLYGVIGTAGGLDVMLGYFPLLAGILLLSRASRHRHVLAFGAVVLGVVLLVLIAAKAVILAVIAALAAVALYFRASLRRAVLLLLALSTGIAVAVTVAPPQNHEYYGLFSPSEWFRALTEKDGLEYDPNHNDTGTTRIKLAQMAIAEIAQHPLVGVGARPWTYVAPHPHNIILEGMLVAGVLAGLAFAAFAMLLLLRLARAVTRPEHLPSGWLAAVASLCTYLIVYNLIQGQLASFRSLPLFLVCGFAVALTAKQPAAPADSVTSAG